MDWMGGKDGKARPLLPEGEHKSAGGQIRTVDPALMRRVLSPTELLRQESAIVAWAHNIADSSNTFRRTVHLDQRCRKERNHQFVMADQRISVSCGTRDGTPHH